MSVEVSRLFKLFTRSRTGSLGLESGIIPGDEFIDVKFLPEEEDNTKKTRSGEEAGDIFIQD